MFVTEVLSFNSPSIKKKSDVKIRNKNWSIILYASLFQLSRKKESSYAEHSLQLKKQPKAFLKTQRVVLKHGAPIGIP